MEWSTWKDKIWYVLRQFADPEYQERVWWQGKGPECSSFVEASSMLFDDLNIEIFIQEGREHGISLDTQNKLKEFTLLLDRLSDRLPYGKREQIYKAPEWAGITKLASYLVNKTSTAEESPTQQ